MQKKKRKRARDAQSLADRIPASLPTKMWTPALSALRLHPLGKNAAVIGEVLDKHPGFVMMKTRAGGTRVVTCFRENTSPNLLIFCAAGVDNCVDSTFTRPGRIIDAMSVRMFSILSKWPLVRQIRERKDGTGIESMSDKTRAMHARIDDAKVARSICPYCGVGCGQLVYHKDGKLISIEGDPESPISQGNLCPKGAASYQLLTHSQRQTKIKYRAPRARQWTEISLDRAMDMVADRVWESRKRTFVTQENGATINHTTAICHLGGATLDNEENYLIKKLFTGGLGMVCVSNQARI
jgi:formate dehydrogenase major subunit